jgi:hypothetical protein
MSPAVVLDPVPDAASFRYRQVRTGELRSTQQCTVPMPVDFQREWVDWVLFSVQLASLIVTGIAVVLAYLEIRQARGEAKKGQEAQLKERRVDFELTVLRELLIAAQGGDLPRVEALASTLTPSVVPITRAAVELPTT